MEVVAACASCSYAGRVERFSGSGAARVQLVLKRREADLRIVCRFWRYGCLRSPSRGGSHGGRDSALSGLCCSALRCRTLIVARLREVFVTFRSGKVNRRL
jgi:hypothetical protein